MASTDAQRPGRARKLGLGTREQIVQQAVVLFARNGYANTALDDIALAVGIKKPSLYHYIRTKEDLLYEIHRLLAQEALDEVNGLLATAATPHEKVLAFFRGTVRLVARRRLEMTVFLNETHQLNSRNKRWREISEKRDAYQKLFEDVLADGMAAGAFRKLPVTVTALGLLGMVTWSYQWYRPDGLTPDELADLYADIALNGLTT